MPWSLEQGWTRWNEFPQLEKPPPAIPVFQNQRECDPFAGFLSLIPMIYLKYRSALKFYVAMHNNRSYINAIPRVADERGQPWLK